MCSNESTRKPLEALEREITKLASEIHAATCRWLNLIAEFDRREGWAGWGFASCAQWVSWRCGIAPVAAREHVRVARRLEELPLVRDAFAAGRLSFSKVRALTRVGDVVAEADLLELARHATAAQLERLVRGYRRVEAVERAAAGGSPERWVDWSYDDDGSLLLRARLPQEEGAVVLAALEAALDAGASAQARGSDGGPGRAPADDEATGENERAVVVQVAADASAEARGHEGDGDARSVPVDADDASMQAPSLGEQRADALVLMGETMLAAGPTSRPNADRYQIVVHVDAPALGGGEADAGARCELADGAPLATRTAQRLACDAAIVALTERGGTVDVGRRTRAVPPALRRALAARDRSCRFPGCDGRRVDAHHIEHWARGGPTNLANLVQLCPRHHRLVHEGGYRVERARGGTITFRRPDGRRIPACPASPAARPNALRRRADARRVRWDACVSLSAGERMDPQLGVDALLAAAPLGEPRGRSRRPVGRLGNTGAVR